MGAAQRADEELVTHRTSVDEQILVLGIAARIGRQAGKAREPYAFAFCVDLERIIAKIRAEDGPEPSQPSFRAGLTRDGF